MKAIHLKCEDRLNLTCIKMPIFESGFWDIPTSDAEAVVGGMIFLHQTKDATSYFGGRVLEVRQEECPELAHSKRLVFVVEATAEGKGMKWRGANHAMAWYSGLVDA